MKICVPEFDSGCKTFLEICLAYAPAFCSGIVGCKNALMLEPTAQLLLHPIKMTSSVDVK